MISKNRTTALLFIVTAVSLLYGQFLWNPLVFDDIYLFLADNEGNQRISDYSISLLEIRALPYATLAWTKEVFGLDLIYFRIGNLALHILVSCTLYLLIMQLLAVILPAAKPQPERPSLSNNQLALIATLIFALHPISSYGCAYLIQRTILMATLFSLLSLLCYLLACKTQQRRYLALSAFSYYLAVLSKEHAIMLPAVILALSALTQPDWLKLIKKQSIFWLALASIGSIVVAIKLQLIGATYEKQAAVMLTQQSINAESAHFYSILTQSGLFFKYIVLWLLPNTGWMSIDMREPFADSLTTYYTLGALAFIGYGIACALMIKKRGYIGLLGFLLLYPWLMFMTEFAAVRVQEPFVLYRSYLWMPLLCLLLPLLFYRMHQRLALLCLGLFVLILIPLTWERLNTLSHPLLLWDDAARLIQDKDHVTGKERIYYNRGNAFQEAELLNRAIADYNTVLELRPDYWQALSARGNAYLKAENFSAALKSFDLALEQAPNCFKCYQGKAKAYKASGDYSKYLLNHFYSCQAGSGYSCQLLRDEPADNVQSAIPDFRFPQPQ